MGKDKRRSLYGARGWRLNKKALVQERACLGGTAAKEQVTDLAISPAPPNHNAKRDGNGIDPGQQGEDFDQPGPEEELGEGSRPDK